MTTVSRSAALTKIEEFDFNHSLVNVRPINRNEAIDLFWKAVHRGQESVRTAEDAKQLLASLYDRGGAKHVAADIAEKYSGFKVSEEDDLVLGFFGNQLGITGKNAENWLWHGRVLVRAAPHLKLLKGLLPFRNERPAFAQRTAEPLKRLLGKPDEVWAAAIKDAVQAAVADAEPKGHKPKLKREHLQEAVSKQLGAASTGRPKSANSPEKSGHSFARGTPQNSHIDDLDDVNDDRIDDRQRVLRLLGDAEEAIEALAGRFPKHKGIAALWSAISRVYEQVNDLELSKAQLDSLWNTRR